MGGGAAATPRRPVGSPQRAPQVRGARKRDACSGGWGGMMSSSSAIGVSSSVGVGGATSSSSSAVRVGSSPPEVSFLGNRGSLGYRGTAAPGPFSTATGNHPSVGNWGKTADGKWITSRK